MTTATRTATRVGTCGTCGQVNAATTHATYTPCACGAGVKTAPIRGTYSDATPCDDRCQYAAGPKCSCQCGGDNHAAGYIAGEVPAAIRARDTARHTAKSARAESVRQTKEAAIAARAAGVVAANPALAPLLGDTVWDNYFIGDIARKFADTGELSARQIDAVIDAMEKETARAAALAAREAAAAAATAAGVKAPTGKVTVTGVIRSVRPHTTYYGGVEQTTWKMTVDTTDGWGAWMTCPAHLITGARAESHEDWTRRLAGRAVTVTATFTPANDDPLFAYGKLPKAVLAAA